MPECLLQTKGSVTSPLKRLRNLEMPGQTAQRNCFSSGAPVQQSADSLGRKIKSERGCDEDRRDASSLLYTLAAAAASRDSPPNLAVKQENRSSPSACDSIGDCHDASDQTTDTLSREDAQSHANGAARDVDSYNAFQQRMLLGSGGENKNVLPKQNNQLHLMEAMMQRQRQLYEEYGHSNWMKMQRNDSNCLSKSKAKRYRWCVQKEQENDATEEGQVTSSAVHAGAPSDHQPPANSKKKMQPKRGSAATNGPMHDKLYGTVFTGASKFRCRDCGKSFTTLLDLTVHMSKTGHYRDQNVADMKGNGDEANGKFAKPKKRSIIELDEKESAEKVLKCLGCGHSFDSLQDLTVHMIKTKHYEDVPTLRLYSQKQDYQAMPSSSGPSPLSEDKSNSTINPQLSCVNSPAYPIRDTLPESVRVSSGYHDAAAHGFMSNPAFSSSVAGHPNFANMLNMAALRLLGTFPPYMMQMPFPNAMAGYDMAYAAAAARMFLSSPWLGQFPGMAPGGVFPSFLNPAAMQSAMFSQPGQQSPFSSDHGGVPPHSSSSLSSRGAYIPSPDRVNAQTSREWDEGERPQYLRCVQCGESFDSFQKMTDHMRETTHFPIAMTPPNEDARRGSRGSSSVEPTARSSPRDTACIASASPLEQLAKFANGTSLSEMKDDTMVRQRQDAGNSHRNSHCSGSPGFNSPRSARRSPVDILSNDRYIRPSTPQKGNEAVLAGSDFIKSLESTIQSAISRVNQPCASPPSEQNQATARTAESAGAQKSKKQYLLQSVAPPSARVHRKSLPNDPILSRCTAEDRDAKAQARSASDSEEYYRRCFESRDGRREEAASSASPPLDLTNRVGSDASDACVKDGPRRDYAAKRTRPTEEGSCPSNARKRWENKKMKAASPPSPKKPKKDAVDTRGASPPAVFSNSGSDPIAEMQKIVNSTDASASDRRLSGARQRPVPAGHKRKSGTPPNGVGDGKLYKPNSVLSDLVRHDDDERAPNINPLMQMENLVNLKLGSANCLETSELDRKSNIAKPYLPALSDSDYQSANGASPMSALLNLFQGTAGLRGFAGPDEARKDPGQRAGGARHYPGKLSISPGPDCRSQAGRLDEKMAEIFSSMIAKERTAREDAGKSPDASRSLSVPQRIQLQAFYAYHHGKAEDRIPDEDLKSLSGECGISVAGIKRWIQDTNSALADNKKCDFILPPESGFSPSFSCTACASKSGQRLSARDFLHHLSIHMRDIRAERYDSAVASGQNANEDRCKPEMKFKGEVHFKSLKSDRSASGEARFSLTAHVTGARVGAADSPDPDAVAGRPRGRVDVIEESPIKAPG